MTGSRQWRWKRKRGRRHQQRATSQTHLDGVQQRINACHRDEGESTAPARPQAWAPGSLQRSPQTIGSLARPLRGGAYSRGLHGPRVTGVLNAILAETRPDTETLTAMAVILGVDRTAPGPRAVFYLRLHEWLRPYLGDHPEMRARLTTWLSIRRGGAGEQTA